MSCDSTDLLFRHITQYFLPQLDEDALIYHYTSPSGLKSILQNKTLWVSDFAFLNDKSENRYLYEVLGKTLKKPKPSLKLNADFLCELTTILNHRTNNIPYNYYRYICSFSSNPDSLSLWNYYTKTATGAGYNIGFDLKLLLSNISPSPEKELKCSKVLYEPTEQIDLLEKAVVGYNSAYESAPTAEEKCQVLSELKSCLDILSAYIKHPAFINEEEVRICITQKRDASIPRDADYREANGIMVPYLSLNFPTDAVKCINVSPTNEKELSIHGISSMLMDFGYSAANVRPSEIPLRN